MGVRISSNQLWNDRRVSSRPVWLKLSVPLVLTLLATWITLHPLVIISYRTPFLLYFGVIFISAAYGGGLSSLTAAVCSAILCLLFVLPKHAADTSFFIGATIIFLAESLLLTTVFRAVETARKKLLHSEERFRNVIEKSSEGFLVSTVNGTIQYIAPSVKDLLGYLPASLLQAKVQDLLHPEEQLAFESFLSGAGKKESAGIVFLHRMKHSDNNWQWIEGTVVSQSESPLDRSLVFQYRNVTERINREQQREDFVHMASHELKTPVTALKGFIQLQLQQSRLAGRSDDILAAERMEAQANRIIHLIDDMLDTALISTGEMPYHFQPVDLAACTTAVLASMAVIHSGHVFDFTSTAPVVLVRADRERLAQVISNLVGNAVKYSPGKEKIIIRITMEEGSARVDIKDEGIGISQAQQEKIFERFYRSASLQKNNFKGLGLGLFISAEIIKTHGGRIGVDSEPGKGSNFWFTVPGV